MAGRIDRGVGIDLDADGLLNRLEARRHWLVTLALVCASVAVALSWFIREMASYCRGQALVGVGGCYPTLTSGDQVVRVAVVSSIVAFAVVLLLDYRAGRLVLDVDVDDTDRAMTDSAWTTVGMTVAVGVVVVTLSVVVAVLNRVVPRPEFSDQPPECIAFPWCGLVAESLAQTLVLTLIGLVFLTGASYAHDRWRADQ